MSASFWLGDSHHTSQDADAHYRNGEVWLGDSHHTSQDADARYEDGELWLGAYTSGTPDAHYEGSNGGAVAAAFLLLLSGVDTPTEETNSSKPDSDDEEEGNDEEEDDDDEDSDSDESYEEPSPYSYTPSSPARPPSPEVPGFIVVCIVLGAMLGVGVMIRDTMIRDLNNSPTRNDAYSPSAKSDYSQPANLTPPEQIVDGGECPYEGCQYGEQWMAKEDVNVYDAWPDSLGIASSTLHQKATIHAREWVTTETGVILAKRHEGVVVDNTNYGVVVENGPRLKMGQIISLYSQLGEGCWKSWIEGRFLVVCRPEFQPEKVQNEWWIRIKTADGLQGWTNSPQLFVSQEGLNRELGRKIWEPKLALPDKLAEIDTLLKGGANLNGDGGRYGVSPMEAAINMKDVDLLRELVSKGLNIQGSQFCPASWAAQNALGPGGDIMLEFLLENGMQLGCLINPPLQQFLSMGITTDDYPIEQAIKVAEALVRHGANINQRDSQDKSIFDVLNRPDVISRPHAAVLKEALAKLEVQPPL
jgi:hypothetical protein